MSCDPSKRRMYVLHAPAVEGFWAPAVHANCLHNEEAALRLRTLGETPEDPDDTSYFSSEIARLRNLVRRCNVMRFTREEVVGSYSGRLRRRYQEALVDLDIEGGIRDKDAMLSAFIKAEKFNPMLKASKPRMIMARTPRYNLELARYLKPLEHAIWNKWRVGFGGAAPTRMVGKGLNHKQRAALLRRKMETVGDCTVFEIDGKAFEAHVTIQQINSEHSVYKAAYPGEAELRSLLRYQRSLKGRTAGGIRYSRDGCRASGDFNTGLGNTLIMGCATNAVIRRLQMRRTFRATVLADGDNCLVFVETRYASWVAEAFKEQIGSVIGQELTVEKPVTKFEAIMFGQSRPCWNGDEYVMVRDPIKSVSHSFSGYRHYNHYTFGLRLAKSIAIAELNLVRGVPIVEAYYATALAKLKHIKHLTNPEDYLEGHLLEATFDPAVKPRGVTAEARRSFAHAWGIGVEEQLTIESKLMESLASFPNPSYLNKVVEVRDEASEPIDAEEIRGWTYLGERYH